MREFLLSSFLFLGSAFVGSALAEEGGVDVVQAPPPVEVAYVIGPGDTLEIQVFGQEDLTGDRVVGASGSLDFPLLGQVEVKGLTVQGLDDRLTKALGEKYLRDPQVQVVVKAYGSQRVVVRGAIKKPGEYHLSGPTTVLDIIAQAGGVAEEGVSQVRIQHQDRSRPDTVVNLEQLRTEGNAGVKLIAGDRIDISKPLVVYVSGEVNKPGAVAYTEGLTVTQALTRSGGTKRTAKLRDAYILRGNEKLAINIKKILAGKTADVSLKPNDQLILKESVF
jgi:polysaccharide export outer membrane protein